MSSKPDVAGPRALVLDSNILVRAVLCRRVLRLLQKYSGSVDFLAPEIAFAEVRTHLPAILAGRGLSQNSIHELVEREVLLRLPMLVASVPYDVYGNLEAEARRCLSRRDEADWPFVALALRFGCPIWTEDRDFFGSGIATWTTDRIEIYLG